IRDLIVTGVQTCALPILGLVLGATPRLFAALAWATHLLLASGQVTSYGVDTFAHVFLFFLIWAPSGWREEVSSRARFWLRLMQRSEERRVGKEGRVWWGA